MATSVSIWKRDLVPPRWRPVLRPLKRFNWRIAEFIFTFVFFVLIVDQMPVLASFMLIINAIPLIDREADGLRYQTERHPAA